MSSPDVSAILVNYNAGPELRYALRSIADELPGSSWEAVVIDNASIDGSADLVAEFAPQASLVRNKRNVGFAAAVNQALRRTSAPFVLVMNPDCRLVGGAVAALRAELERHRTCAMVGPRILDPDGSVQGSARGDPDMLTGLFGRTALLRRALPELAISKRNVVADDPRQTNGASVTVDWISGACILARREALRAVEGFDERYFLYWEDADICRRLRAEGYHVRYVPAATAIHRVGHSSRTVRTRAIRAFHESAYLYYASHVARGPMSPRRMIARILLAVRCWWMVRGNKGVV
jgi:GT2 family glycosyltransferase